MANTSSAPVRPERIAPSAPPAVADDDVGWLLTFSDLVLQLFAFVLVAAVCGGATRATTSGAGVVPPVTVEAMHEPANDPMAHALEPASAWAADRDDHGTAPRDALDEAILDPAERPVVADDAAAERRGEHRTEPAADAPPHDRASDPDAEPAERARRLQALGGYLGAFVAARGDGDDTVVATSDDDVRLTFGGRLGFLPGSAELTPSGLSLVREVQRIASGVPNVAVEVAGYTDDVPIHTREFPSNLELSLTRAARVAREIQRDDATLAVRTVALGFGEHRAIAPNDGPANRARNRRVEVRLVATAQSMP